MKKILILGIFFICCSSDLKKIKTEFYQKNNQLIFEVSNPSKISYYIVLGSFSITNKDKRIKKDSSLIYTEETEYLELVSIDGQQDINLKKELLKKYSDCEVQQGFEPGFDLYESLGIEKVSNKRFLLAPSNTTIKYIFEPKNLKKESKYVVNYNPLAFSTEGLIAQKRGKALQSFLNIESINGYYPYKDKIDVNEVILKEE